MEEDWLIYENNQVWGEYTMGKVLPYTSHLTQVLK